MYAEAGVPCAKLARQCARWDLGPAEFFTGIPGTVGGALAMNAGAFGGETWQQVRSVETVDRRGAVRVRAASEYAVGYRHVEAPANDEWFLAATFAFRGRLFRSRTRARCWSAASRPSRSASGAAARCSPIRPAITPRA